MLQECCPCLYGSPRLLDRDAGFLLVEVFHIARHAKACNHRQQLCLNKFENYWLINLLNIQLNIHSKMSCNCNDRCYIKFNCLAVHVAPAEDVLPGFHLGRVTATQYRKFLWTCSRATWWCARHGGTRARCVLSERLISASLTRCAASWSTRDTQASGGSLKRNQVLYLQSVLVNYKH